MTTQRQPKAHYHVIMDGIQIGHPAPTKLAAVRRMESIRDHVWSECDEWQSACFGAGFPVYSLTLKSSPNHTHDFQEVNGVACTLEHKRD